MTEFISGKRKSYERRPRRKLSLQRIEELKEINQARKNAGLKELKK